MRGDEKPVFLPEFTAEPLANSPAVSRQSTFTQGAAPPVVVALRSLTGETLAEPIDSISVRLEAAESGALPPAALGVTDRRGVYLPSAGPVRRRPPGPPGGQPPDRGAARADPEAPSGPPADPKRIDVTPVDVAPAAKTVGPIEAVRRAFAWGWLGVELESDRLPDTLPGELTFRQGTRRLTVSVKFGPAPESRFAVADSVASVVRRNEHTARLVVAQGSAPHVVAAELAGAATRWFAEQWWARLSHLLYQRGGLVLDRASRPGRFAVLTPADRGRWAAVAVMSMYAREHPDEWTVRDEAALILRLGDMGLLDGQPHSAVRRRLLSQLGELNAHGRRVLERAWSRAAVTDPASALKRINGALTDLVPLLGDFKGGLARELPDDGGGYELRLRLPGNDGRVVPLILVEPDGRSAVHDVEYDASSRVLRVRTDVSVDALTTELAAVIAEIIASDRDATADAKAAGAKQRAATLQAQYWRQRSPWMRRTVRAMVRRRGPWIETMLRPEEPGRPAASGSTTSPGNAVPRWWMYGSGRWIGALSSITTNLGFGDLGGRAMGLNAAYAATNATRDVGQGELDHLFGRAAQRATERAPGYQPAQLASPDQAQAPTAGGLRPRIVIGPDELAQLNGTTPVPSAVDYLVKLGPAPLLAGGIGGGLLAVFGGAATAAAATAGLAGWQGLAWATAHKVGDHRQLPASKLARLVDEQTPAFQRVEILRGTYYHAMEIAGRLAASDRRADIGELRSVLAAARAALEQIRPELEREVADQLRYLRWRRSPSLRRWRPAALSRPTTGPATRAEADQAGRPSGRAPTYQFLLRYLYPALVSGALPVVTSLLSGGGSFLFSVAGALGTVSGGVGRGFGESWYSELRPIEERALRAFDTLRYLNETVDLIAQVLGDDAITVPRPLLESHGTLRALWHQRRNDRSQGRPADHSAQALFFYKHLPQIAFRSLAALGFVFLHPVAAGAALGSAAVVSVSAYAGEVTFRKLAAGLGRLSQDRALRHIAAQLPFTDKELADRIFTLAGEARRHHDLAQLGQDILIYSPRSRWRRRRSELARRLADRTSRNPPLLSRGPQPPGPARLAHADRVAAEELANTYRLHMAKADEADPPQATIVSLDRLGLLTTPGDPAGARPAAAQRWEKVQRYLTSVGLLSLDEAHRLDRLREAANTAGTPEAALIPERDRGSLSERLLHAVWSLAAQMPAALSGEHTVLLGLAGKPVAVTVREAPLPDGVQARLDLAPDDIVHAIGGTHRKAAHTLTVSTTEGTPDAQALRAALLDAHPVLMRRRTGRRQRMYRLVLITPAPTDGSVDLPATGLEAPRVRRVLVRKAGPARDDRLLTPEDAGYYYRLARRIGWIAATQAHQRLGHAAARKLGLRTSTDKADDFVRYIVHHGEAVRDAVTDRLYRLDVNGETVLVRARHDAKGQLIRARRPARGESEVTPDDPVGLIEPSPVGFATIAQVLSASSTRPGPGSGSARAEGSDLTEIPGRVSMRNLTMEPISERSLEELPGWFGELRVSDQEVVRWLWAVGRAVRAGANGVSVALEEVARWGSGLLGVTPVAVGPAMDGVGWFDPAGWRVLVPVGLSWRESWSRLMAGLVEAEVWYRVVLRLGALSWPVGRDAVVAAVGRARRVGRWASGWDPVSEQGRRQLRGVVEAILGSDLPQAPVRPLVEVLSTIEVASDGESGRVRAVGFSTGQDQFVEVDPRALILKPGFFRVGPGQPWQGRVLGGRVGAQVRHAIEWTPRPGAGYDAGSVTDVEGGDVTRAGRAGRQATVIGGRRTVAARTSGRGPRPDRAGPSLYDPAVERAYLAAADNARRRSVLIDALPRLTHAAMHALAGFAADNARTGADRADAQALRLLAFALSPSYVAGGEPDWIAGLDKVGRYEWSTAALALHRKLPQSRAALKPLLQTLVRCAPVSS
ncbi:hypothetical protein ABZ591_31715 [Micromonospora fulviviridis]|uniref:hypothetical protein n=1 Tax=Micromonospora fulviviridis TaxID=47860 RepID=UPI003401AC7F